jgi:hypothetical protein
MSATQKTLTVKFYGERTLPLRLLSWSDLNDPLSILNPQVRPQRFSYELRFRPPIPICPVAQRFGLITVKPDCLPDHPGLGDRGLASARSLQISVFPWHREKHTSFRLTYGRYDVYNSRSCGFGLPRPKPSTALVHLSGEAGESVSPHK